MKKRFKSISLVIVMLILYIVTGSVAPLAAPAEASTRTTLNGQAVENRRVGAVRGRGGVELARAASLELALERPATATPAGPDARVDITPGTMLIRHGSRELFILADTRTAFLTTGIGNSATHATNPLRTTSVTLSVLPRTVAARDLFVPFNDVIRHLGGSFTAARTASLRADAPDAAFDFTATGQQRDVVSGAAGVGSELRMVGRGATFPDGLYGRNLVPGATVPAGEAPWLPLYFAASQDLSGATPGIRVGYNRINLAGTSLASTADDLPAGVTGAALRGSGVGVDAVRLRQADFGGTDMLSVVPAAVREAFPPIPTVKGGVAVIFNVNDTAGNRIRHLNMTADVIARIYLGQISRWNDPLLVRLNPGVALPDEPIRVNWRPDVSGTTEIFTAYLNAASRIWRETLTAAQRTTVDIDGATPGDDTPDGAGVVEPGVGGWTVADFAAAANRAQQAHGTGGGALEGRVIADLNSIGYISFGDVHPEFTAGQVGIARVQNRSGIFVLPLLANVYAAGLGHGNLLAHPVNGANPGAYPITGLTWIMVEKDPAVAKPVGDSVQIAGPDSNIGLQIALTDTTTPTLAEALRRNAVVVDFIRWAVVEGFGDAEARRLQMAPLTPAMKREAARLLDTIQVQTN